uniref:Uncharacterized protein n=1 Tax=Acanthochromis polyacanthus TaxID=80966 RepID=A0A3Q1FGK4_9TELE
MGKLFLHCCTSCLQALKMNSEPGSESMKNTRLFHTKMKLALHFLRNETECYHTSRSLTCKVYMSRQMTSQGVVRQSSGSMRWLNLGLVKNSCCAKGLCDYYQEAVTHPLRHQDVHLLWQLDLLSSPLQHRDHLLTSVLLHQLSRVVGHGARLYSIHLQYHTQSVRKMLQQHSSSSRWQYKYTKVQHTVCLN